MKLNRRAFFEKSALSTADLAAKAGVVSLLHAGSLPQRASSDPANQVVVITGAGSGFGYRMALTFARSGYRTYATLRETRGRNRQKADGLRNVARSESLSLFVEELDVIDPRSAKGALDRIVEREGRVDVLVNNAGVLVYAPLEVVPRDVWDLQMATNVYGPLELSGLVLPIMRRQGSGLVINMSSRVGRVTIPGIGLYATSKFALETAVETKHYESTPQGIDFALIQPTAFDTDINRNARRIYETFSLPRFNSERPEGVDFHREFLERLDGNFSGNPTRNPQEVADLALRIVETPRAERVLRYPIGDEGELSSVRDLNSVHRSVQRTALRDSGYGDLYRD